MKRKISCPDFAFPLLSHDAVLDLIASMEIPGVDIGLLENRSHLRPGTEFEHLKENAKRLKERVEERSLVISDIFMQAELDFVVYAANHPDGRRRAHARELFEKTIEYAVLAGAGHITGLPGCAFPEQESWEESYERCVKEMEWRAGEARKAGLEFGIEAHVGSVVEKPEQAKRLCEDVPQMGLTLDYSHFVRQGLKDTEGDILIPYANHMHTRAASHELLQTCLSDNEIGFERILRLLDQHGYQGWYCAEYYWTPNWENCCRNDNVSEILLIKQKLEEI